MNLQTKIDDDLRQAIIDRNKERSDLLKVVVAELSRYPTKEVSDEDVLKKLKMMKDGAIACNNTSELEILEVMHREGLFAHTRCLVAETHERKFKDLRARYKALRADVAANYHAGKVNLDWI